MAVEWQQVPVTVPLGYRFIGLETPGNTMKMLSTSYISILRVKMSHLYNVLQI